MSFQEVTIVGNLGRDPEMRYTSDGVPVTSFNVATNRRWNNQDGSKGEETVWFRVSVWRRMAEVCAQYLTKGRQVMVKGRLNADPETGGPRVWKGNDGESRSSFEITASNVLFLGKRGETGDVGDDGTMPEEDGADPF